jgi:hypothetical protein
MTFRTSGLLPGAGKDHAAGPPTTALSSSLIGDVDIV